MNGVWKDKPLMKGSQGMPVYLPIAGSNGLYLGVRPLLALGVMVGPLGPTGAVLASGLRLRAAATGSGKVSYTKTAGAIDEWLPEMKDHWQRRDQNRSSLIMQGVMEFNSHMSPSKIRNSVKTRTSNMLDELLKNIPPESDYALRKNEISEYLWAEYNKALDAIFEANGMNEQPAEVVTLATKQLEKKNEVTAG